MTENVYETSFIVLTLMFLSAYNKIYEGIKMKLAFSVFVLKYKISSKK